MTSEKMAKRAAGVHHRTGSSVWQWRIKTPTELQSLYPTQWAARCSLGTSDLKDANGKAATLQAQWMTRFDEQRKMLNPLRVEHVTPEMGKLLAERVTASILGTDEKLRNEPETARLLLDALRPFRKGYGLTIGPYAPPAPIAAADADPLDGLPLELLLELGAVNEATNAYAGQQLAMQRLAAVLPLVKHEALALGLLFDEKAPGSRDALRECLKAFRTTWQNAARRDDGQAVDTPQALTLLAMKQARPTKLRGVLAAWKSSKARKKQTEQAAELALALYEKATGNPPIASLTRAQGVECRAFLLDQGTTAKTARDRFDYIKGFLNFAARDMELLPKNPWEGLAIEHTTTSPRRPWSGEQLTQLFAKPLFTEYMLPTSWDGGGDGAYWVPLLGVYAGARLGELCQLDVSDVETIDGVPLIHITDLGDGDSVKSVKTEAGRRLVPVHPELVRLGFLEYVDALRKASSRRLFPALRLAPSKPSNYFSSWFKTLREVEGGKELPDFHSLRHTVRSKLASVGIAEPMIDTLIGHEVKGSTGAKIYTERTVEDLLKAMTALSYSKLCLPRVYSAPVYLIEPTRRRSTHTA